MTANHWTGQSNSLQRPIIERRSPLDEPLASPGARLGAYLLDLLFFLILFGIGWIIWSLVVWSKGTTPGHQVLHLYFVSEKTGRTATWGQTALREFIIKGLIGGLLTLVTVGVYLILDSLLIGRADRRTIHDMLSSTLVVQRTLKPVLLRNPFGQLKKFKIALTHKDITLGNSVIARDDVVDCRRIYRAQHLRPAVILMGSGLVLWTIYEGLSLFLTLFYRFIPNLLMRLQDWSGEDQTAFIDSSIDVSKQFLIIPFRFSTTIEQQSYLVFWLYFFSLIYFRVISNLILRPRISITSKSGETIELPYLIVFNLGRLEKCLKQIRKIARNNRLISNY